MTNTLLQVIDVDSVVYCYLVGGSHDGRVGYWCIVRTTVVHAFVTKDTYGEGVDCWHYHKTHQHLCYSSNPLYTMADRQRRGTESKRCCCKINMIKQIIIMWNVSRESVKNRRCFSCFLYRDVAASRVWYVNLCQRKPFRG